MVATYAWLCGGEFPSQRLRSYTFGLASSVGFLGAWLATFTAPYFINPDALNWGNSLFELVLDIADFSQVPNMATFGALVVCWQLPGYGSIFPRSRIEHSRRLMKW
jgi:hypothetical protein